MTRKRILFRVPNYWTQEQAYAVYELLQDLCECILSHYSQEIIDEFREQHMPPDVDKSRSAPKDALSCGLDDDDLPF